jgi:hypothetical protein
MGNFILCIIITPAENYGSIYPVRILSPIGEKIQSFSCRMFSFFNILYCVNSTNPTYCTMAFSKISIRKATYKSGSIFTKICRCKHKRRIFVRSKISKVPLERSAIIYSKREVKFISYVFAPLVCTVVHLYACNIWIYVYACVYEIY